MTKRVVVLGKGVLARKVADWFLEHSDEYTFDCVIPVIPESWWQPSLREWAEEKKVACIASGNFEEVGEPHDIDLAVSVNYVRIIKPPFIARCKRIINIHNAPLPKYRGMAPINWALKNGESEHGVTIHEIDAGIDTGPIIGQVRFPINPEVDEVIDVYERCLNFGWKLFKETMPNFWSIVPQPQDESQAVYYNAKDSARLGDRSSFTRRESTR